MKIDVLDKGHIELVDTLAHIKERGVMPGIIVEAEEHNLKKIWRVLQDISINWILVMGVPIGYGGQLFQPHVLKKITYFRRISAAKNYALDIEVDGGLTSANIGECYRQGADIFAGWSIIKDKSIAGIKEKYENILKIIAP